MLVSSDGYRRQFEPLDIFDIETAWSSLSLVGEDYVAFYNYGRDGGCGRLHKHMQFMPMPATGFSSFLDDEIGEETAVPYEWAFGRFDSYKDTSFAELTQTYNALLERMSVVYDTATGKRSSLDAGAAIPHNMIPSKSWMVLLPRKQSAINKEAGANALGLLGVIAVATQKEIDTWVALGLRESLKVLGIPRS